MTEKITMNKASIYLLSITALFVALTYVFTAFVNIRLPIAANGGLIHLGNVPLFIAAILFGRKVGAIAGGVGMALFDLLSGWTLWAPFTLVIVGLMGYVTGLIAENKQKLGWYVIAFAIVCAIKVVGYYIAETIIYQNIFVPISSIPGNILQVAIAAVIVSVIIIPLRKAVSKTIL